VFFVFFAVINFGRGVSRPGSICGFACFYPEKVKGGRAPHPPFFTFDFD